MIAIQSGPRETDSVEASVNIGDGTANIKATSVQPTTAGIIVAAILGIIAIIMAIKMPDFGLWELIVTAVVIVTAFQWIIKFSSSASERRTSSPSGPLCLAFVVK